MPQYSTRAIKRDYLNTYYLSTGVDKNLLRNIFKVLTHDQTCAENPSEAEADERVMTFLIDSDELEEDILDLRRLNAKKAMQYTGRFQLKFKVQQRLNRKEHIDSKFATVQYNLMKQFALMWRDNALMYVDDKATIPVGEPDTPLSTGARGHNKVLVPVDGCLAALHHDWHGASVVPSVAFIVDVPERPGDLFYNGQNFVTTKDRVFMPSSPNRHGTETLRLLRDHYSGNGTTLDKDILLIYSDGGPDHRVTYGLVQVPPARCGFPCSSSHLPRPKLGELG